MTDEGLPMVVGRLSGRMDAMEGRVTRHEDFVGENFANVNSKLDRLLEHQSRGVGSLGLIRWVIGLGATASGWGAFFLGKGH